jgi:hypothetical protein
MLSTRDREPDGTPRKNTVKTGRLILALTVPLLLVAAKEKDAAEWKELAPKDGGFSVMMPGAPIEQKESLRLPSGPVDLLIYAVERKRDETAFIAMYCELPEAVFKNGTNEKRLDYARNRAVAATKGKLTGEKKLKLGANPGRELLFEVEGKGQVRQVLYVVKDKLYQLLVAGPKEKTMSKDADRFLQSFKLKP